MAESGTVVESLARRYAVLRPHLDERDDRAGGRVGLLAGVDRARLEACAGGRTCPPGVWLRLFAHPPRL